MATESPIRITETSTTWASVKGTSAYGSSSTNIAIDELGLLLKNQTFQGNGRALVPSRSGSAPPSMEGSFAAAKNILAKQNFDLNTSFTGINASIDSYVLAEKKLHADSAYVAYSSDVNMSPRTTPSLIPRDNRRLFRQIGSAGYNRRLTSSDDYDSCSGSLLMSHSKLPTHKEELEDDRSAQRNPANGTDKSISFSSPSEELEDDRSAQRNPANGTDKSISFSSPSEATTGQLKGVLGTMQEDISDSKSNVYSQGPFFIDESVEEAVSRDADGSLHDLTLCTSIPSPSADDMQQSSHPDQTGLISSSASLASVTSTLLKPDLHRTQSLTVDSDLGDYISTSSVTDTVLTSIDSNMNSTSVRSNPSSKDQRHNHEQRYRLEVQNSQSQFTSQGINHTYIGTNQIFHGPSNYSEAELQPVTQSSAVCPPLYATAAADHMNSSTLLYQNLHPSSYFSPQYTLGGYAFQSEGLSPYVAGYVPQAVVPVAFDDDAHPNFSPGTSFGGITSYGVNMQHLNNYFGQFGFPMQPSITDPLHMQYFQHSFGDAYGLPGRFEFPPRAGATGNPLNAADSHKGSGLSVFSVEQNFQHQGSVGHSYLNPGRVGFPYYIGRPRDAGLLQFPVSTVSSPPGTPVGGTSLFSGTNEMRFSPRSSRNLGISYGWQGKRGPDDFKSFSFLEELKSGKGRRVELSDIVGHIIEFSGDQHGSRFIQQKLESCSVQEKEAVFKEVLPNTSKLMTDVFGNYVIQKFFEYGSLEQRKQLANQLAGQILPLSLQMYGCRVIQKALDVIEPEQKIKLVHELDGHVLRCVRDQNGNHVIQKCIETIPTFQIEFIISSFRGEVAKLSTHPYGCRVIQRVLEHCTSDLQSQFIVDEILESVCSLAQDQYGNYVIQHVLERGKPSERRLIISKLSEHIVQLSQHKFASNVVEKCLEYGDSASLEIMIGEIIGQGDGNDNLLTMVKDQYANYVIQKIIQTSNADQREMLLGRIRIHLNSLKKYTYGKHIVTRFERLYGEDLRNKDPDNFTE